MVKLFSSIKHFKVKQLLLFPSLLSDAFFLFIPFIIQKTAIGIWALYALLFALNIISKLLDAFLITTPTTTDQQTTKNSEKKSDSSEKFTKWFFIAACMGTNIATIIKNKNTWLPLLALCAFKPTLSYILLIAICTIYLIASIIKQKKSVEKATAKIYRKSYKQNTKDENKILKSIFLLLKSLLSIAKSTLPFLGIAGMVLLPGFILNNAPAYVLIIYAIITGIAQIAECWLYNEYIINTKSAAKEASAATKTFTYITLGLSMITRAVGLSVLSMFYLNQLTSNYFISIPIATFIAICSILKFITNAHTSSNHFLYASTHQPPPNGTQSPSRRDSLNHPQAAASITQQRQRQPTILTSD